MRLDLGGQLGEVLCDGALGQRRGNHDAVGSLALGVDESGQDMRLEAIEQLLD